GQATSTECQLIKLGWGAGSPEANACQLRQLQSISPQVAKSVPTPQQHTPALANDVYRLQAPREERLIQVPAPSQQPPAYTRPASTFVCGTPPNQHPCPVTIGPSRPELPPATNDPASNNPFFPGYKPPADQAAAIEARAKERQ